VNPPAAHGRSARRFGLLDRFLRNLPDGQGKSIFN
jgi:hypothetical protein